MARGSRRCPLDSIEIEEISAACLLRSCADDRRFLGLVREWHQLAGVAVW